LNIFLLLASSLKHQAESQRNENNRRSHIVIHFFISVRSSYLLGIGGQEGIGSSHTQKSKRCKTYQPIFL
jgi:hypothetical protein